MAIRIASLWNKKAGLWINGRKNVFDRLQSQLNDHNAQLIWVHCSSLGEFEQGRPVIEKIKSKYPNFKILLTFFSPSGYEIRKDYKVADWVSYLPMDSSANAKRFIDLVKPQITIFIKYDYWYYYLNECKKRNIPLLLVSAIFRRQQPFFKWYGELHRKMLKYFSCFFVQDKESFELLGSISMNNVIVTGDTRFDRVSEIAENFKPIPEIEKFCGSSNVLVAGSTWPDDEKIIKEAIDNFPDLKVIIAPHEIHKERLKQLKQDFSNSIYFSELTTSNQKPITNNCLIIDNIGMLSRLYHYATITYIGGGFNKGIHNTLEAAVYGKPVLFGPNYNKFKEAIDLIESGGAIKINSSSELTSQLKKLLSDKKILAEVSKRSFDFVQKNKGATEKIFEVIQENLRFTR